MAITNHETALNLIEDAEYAYGLNYEEFAKYLINNYLSGDTALDAARSYLVDERGLDAYAICEDDEEEETC